MRTRPDTACRSLGKEKEYMKKRVFFGLIILTLIVLPWLVAYAKQPAAPAAILVGNPASLTGMFAGFGQGQVFGMKAAVDDINKQGGVYVKEYGKKLPIKLIVVNSESDPLKAGTLAERIRNNVNRMAALTSDLSDLNRVESGKI